MRVVSSRFEHIFNLGLLLTGEIHIGGQEHFYLESNITLAVPRGEDGEMELFVSTQNAYETQVKSLPKRSHQHIETWGTDGNVSLFQCLVAKVLGVPNNRVVVRVKRMGGGFGGKESRSTVLSTVVAVAADKYIRHSISAIVSFRSVLRVLELSCLCQVEEACEVHAGQRRGHADHWRETPLLWKIQSRSFPPAG